MAHFGTAYLGPHSSHPPSTSCKCLHLPEPQFPYPHNRETNSISESAFDEINGHKDFGQDLAQIKTSIKKTTLLDQQSSEDSVYAPLRGRRLT